MRKTEAKYGADARNNLFDGVKKVYDAVAPTMGARGRNAIYHQWMMPIVTNDGISIARKIVPEDDYEYLGAETVKQASERTNQDAGDGTTGTIICATHMIEGGLGTIDAGYNPMVLRKEMEGARVKLVDALKEKSTPVTDLKQVAMISVEDEYLADLVSGVVEEVGADGSILVNEWNGTDIRSETMKGYTWNGGFVSPYMVTNQKGESVLHDAAVIVTDRNLNLNTDLIQILQQLGQQGIKNVFVVSREFDGELLQTAIANRQQGNMNIVAVKAPNTLEELEDIATVTGATAITKDKGIKDITMEHVGSTEKVIATRERTIVLGQLRLQAEIDARITEIRTAIADSDDQQHGDVEVHKLRLSRLAGGIATIKVGGHTEAERAYHKMKVDDAVGACQSALQEGIVPGCGTTLIDLSELLDERVPGERIIQSALREPYRRVLENAGFSQEDIDQNKKLNVFTGEEVDDMLAAGIVDPAKVLRCIIENSISTAKTLLTTECAIVDVPEEKKN